MSLSLCPAWRRHSVPSTWESGPGSQANRGVLTPHRRPAALFTAPRAGRPEGDCVLRVTEARGLRSSFRQAAPSQGRPRPPSQHWGLLNILGVPCFVARPSNVCPTFTWPSPLVQTSPVSHWVWPTGRHCDLTSTNDVSIGPVFHTRVTSGSPGVRTSTQGGPCSPRYFLPVQYGSFLKGLKAGYQMQRAAPAVGWHQGAEGCHRSPRCRTGSWAERRGQGCEEATGPQAVPVPTPDPSGETRWERWPGSMKMPRSGAGGLSGEFGWNQTGDKRGHNMRYHPPGANRKAGGGQMLPSSSILVSPSQMRRRWEQKGSAGP